MDYLCVEPTRFRTYDPTFSHNNYLDRPGVSGGGCEQTQVPNEASIVCKIWEACRATSAAPTFFRSAYIRDVGPGGRTLHFVDAGLGFNNPTEEVIDEAHQLWPGKPIGCILSIGTGKPKAG